MEIVHPFFERCRTTQTIGQPCAAPVVQDESSERGDAFEGLRYWWVFVDEVDVGRPHRNEDDVVLAFTHDSICEPDPIVVGELNRRLHPPIFTRFELKV